MHCRSRPGSRASATCAAALALTLASCAPVGDQASITVPDPAPTASGVSTGEDAAAKRARELEAYARFLKLDPVPSVAPVRFVSVEEFNATQVQCMSEAGYELSMSGSYDVNPDQTSALNLALYTCAAQYPLADRYEQPYSREQQEIIYHYFVDTLAPCLRSHRVTVPDPPSLEAFLASAGTENEYNPYVFVPDTLSATEREDLSGACPQLPPSDELWGEG